MFRNTPGIAFLGQKKWAVLALAVVIDALGLVSYVLPVVGEGEDAAWAPVSALLVQALYGNGLLTTLDFVEEALPFTDVLPTATLGWVIQYTSLGRGVQGAAALQGAGAKDKEKEKKK